MSNQLFFLSLADIFSIYPSIFKELIAAREKPHQVYLPSDGDWQEKMYYRLLDVQKRVNEAIESGLDHDEVTKRKEKPIFDQARIIQKFSPTTSPNGLRFENRKRCVPLAIRFDVRLNRSLDLSSICKAAKLLRRPPPSVHFDNEHEMRRVYSLIYDVFRYKIVLSNALKEITFFEDFPHFREDKNRIWLMLYELFNRGFQKRNAEDTELQWKLFREAEVDDISETLWQYRVRLSASISKMRIRCKALQLSQLLPLHLQNEKVAIAAANPVVTGWINPFMLRDKASTDSKLRDMGFVIRTDDGQPLQANECKWDNVCPLFISCIPKDRSEFAKSDLMTNNYFIIQDKTFSYGPAVMSRLLDFYEVDGDILQTHISSPRSTAYLAALFYSVNRVNNFFVYGAGSNLKDYRKYMETLGISNIRLFAESFSSFPLESKRFGTIVGIFANPPNSFSAISDPIDLICSRGGDLSMLEVLTESEISEDGKQRVSLILEEQLRTLVKAMSRPQIQFIMYQTHSIVNAENQDMVDYVLQLINGLSLRKHKMAYRERKRLEALAEAEAANIPAAAGGGTSSSPRKPKTSNVESTTTTNTTAPAATGIASTGTAATDKEQTNDSVDNKLKLEDSEENVQLPDIDEFVVDDIPDICLNQDKCLTFQATGCFLSLVRRQNITRLNAKYLIRMAELRGLFGKADKSKSAKAKIKAQESHLDGAHKDALHGLGRQQRPINIDTLIKRLMTDTNASSIRSNLIRASRQHCPIRFNFKMRYCVRYKVSKKFHCQHSVQSHSKLLWRHAWQCLRAAQTGGNAYVRFPHNRVSKLRRYNFCRKLPYPIRISDIQMLTDTKVDG